MTKRSNNNPPKIAVEFFNWTLRCRNGLWYADGRSGNPFDLGRHSLGTRDVDEAVNLVRRLDLTMAVKHGLVDRSVLDENAASLLPLEEGVRLYTAHVARPEVLGGPSQKTRQRYRAVFDKFVPFARTAGATSWQQVNKRLLESYAAHLEEELYAYRTQYFELNTLTQANKWLVEEGHLPGSCRIKMPMKKATGTETHCYSPAEVQAMITRCFADPKLHWIGRVIIALATTGLRIGELVQLRWNDVDLEAGRLTLADERHTAPGRRKGGELRTTKGKRSRTLPLHPQLAKVLRSMDRVPDGRVFHGAGGGRLNPDKVRRSLMRDVLKPLQGQFPSPPDGRGLIDGRLHSFRHYFCSMAANARVPEQLLMNWMGHRDSALVRHYYHAASDESARQMEQVAMVDRIAELLGDKLKMNPDPAGTSPAASAVRQPAQHDQGDAGNQRHPKPEDSAPCDASDDAEEAA